MEDEYCVEKMEPVFIKAPDIERKVIANNLLNNCTVEAKFVLYVIFNTPGELSQLLFNSDAPKKITKIPWFFNENQTSFEDIPKGNTEKSLYFSKSPNKQTVYKYLKLMGWKNPIIQKTIQEVRKFTREILEFEN